MPLHVSFWTYLPEIHILSFECLINPSGMYSLVPVPATVESILADHINLFPFKLVVRGFFFSSIYMSKFNLML